MAKANKVHLRFRAVNRDIFAAIKEGKKKNRNEGRDGKIPENQTRRYGRALMRPA